MIKSTATPSYWLTWNFLVLGLGLIVTVGAAVLLIRKYEGSPRKGSQEKDNNEKRPKGFLYKDEAWSTSHKAIHPAWLLAYRLISLGVLLFILVSDGIVNKTDIFFFYTQWTFCMVTIYFGLGSSLSVYGCIRYGKGTPTAKVGPFDVEKSNGPNLETRVREPAGYVGYAFQIIFQICAGAVVLTDCVYWLIIYPILTDDDYGLQFTVVGLHSVNAICLIGDMILNALHFPFFRFAYFVLYTCTFVAYQWIVHMIVSMWWPYPFLDVSFQYAPLIYLGVGVFHLPCYVAFALVAKLKDWLSRLFRWTVRKLSRDNDQTTHDQQAE